MEDNSDIKIKRCSIIYYAEYFRNRFVSSMLKSHIDIEEMGVFRYRFIYINIYQ